MDTKTVVTYVIDFIGNHKIIGARNLTLEEIENIVSTICTIGEANHGIKIKCKRIFKPLKKR